MGIVAIAACKLKMPDDWRKVNVFIVCSLASCLASRLYLLVARFVNKIKSREASEEMFVLLVAVPLVLPSRLLMSLIIMESNGLDLLPNFAHRT